MRKKIPHSQNFRILTALLLVLVISPVVRGADNFALAISPKGNLIVFGPKGEHAAEFPVPSVAQQVTVGDTSFQVSYGRDANDLLTAIITPSSASPQDLHFNVLSKKIDTDKQAVVTLTFSPNLNHVTVDPGYVGVVQVDSRTLKSHSLADDEAPAPRHHSAPVATASSPAPAPHTSVSVAPREIPPANTSTSSASTASNSPTIGDSGVVVHSKPKSSSLPVAEPGAGAVPASIASTNISRDNSSKDGIQIPIVGDPPSGPMFWSEPVTPPSGIPPAIGNDEMKLVEVTGPVSVKTADGDVKKAEPGMVVPSGSTIKTADGGSAAVFIGGVDSARFLPNSSAEVSQEMKGSTRHTTIDLQEGTIFSRIGRRAGEKQDFKVRTAEGVAAARGTEMASSRQKDSNGHYHHYVYVVKGVVELIVNGHSFKMIAGQGKEVGMGSMPPTADEKNVLLGILQVLQEYNTYLQNILDKVNNSVPLTPQEQAYYQSQLAQSVQFVAAITKILNGPQIPTPGQYRDISELQSIIPAVRRGVNQMFQPYGNQPITPY